jgi:hypothetical protein
MGSMREAFGGILRTATNHARGSACSPTITAALKNKAKQSETKSNKLKQSENIFWGCGARGVAVTCGFLRVKPPNSNQIRPWKIKNVRREAETRPASPDLTMFYPFTDLAH